MKVKYKIMAISAIIATGCIVGISRFQTNECSAISVANVEALTDCEVVVAYDKCCIADTEVNCLPNYMGLIPGRPVSCE